MPQLESTEELAARLEARCDREALLALGDRPDDVLARQALRRHLERCAACRKASFWIGTLGRLLPPIDELHPSSATLTAFVAGELAAEERARIGEHLARCPRCTLLRRGAEAGLAEVERLLASLALAEAGAASLADHETDLHLPLELPAPPLPRALAAEPALEASAPAPEDRRLLLELDGVRVVYFRIGAEATLALFADSVAEIELDVWLDDELRAGARQADAILVPLGAAAELGGRQLRLALRLGDRHVTRSFTLVFGTRT